jgi:hypothetical protein
MRILQRSLQTFYYRLYNNTTEIQYDEYGNEIGYKVGYSDPVEFQANISHATGTSSVEQFGDLENYDKVIITSDMTCPIDETTVLYIDTVPTLNGGEYSPYDYIVRRVARSINSISIAVRKVSVS